MIQIIKRRSNSLAIKATVKTLPDDPLQLQEIIARSSPGADSSSLRQGFRQKSGGEASGVQLPLFDMPEPRGEPEQETTELPGHTRKKAGRKKLPEGLPRVEVVHDIPESEKV